MKPRKENETDAHYIKRLKSANAGLREENASLKAWAGRVNEAVTHLSTNGSTAFQMMAEKAGVRSHPSVTEVVRLLDHISHPQWRNEGRLPRVGWPEDWDMDPPDAWSGDADMSLNSPIADAMELLSAVMLEGPQKFVEPIKKTQEALQRVMYRGVEGIKKANGFKAKEISGPTDVHFKDMSEEQLRDLVSSLGWMALDLAQDMGFANEMLRRDLRATVYRRVCSDLYGMSQRSIEWGPEAKINIKVFGGEEPV